MEIKEKIVNSIIKVSERGMKKDLNSTSSAWAYQPKIPSTIIKHKSNKE